MEVEALERRLKDIEYQIPTGLKRIPWIETLAITSTKPLDEVAVSDDIKREGLFRALTMECTKEALRRLSVLGIPFTRPSDYIADMVKSDDHMKRVQGHLSEKSKKLQLKTKKINKRTARKGKKKNAL